MSTYSGETLELRPRTCPILGVPDNAGALKVGILVNDGTVATNFCPNPDPTPSAPISELHSERPPLRTLGRSCSTPPAAQLVALLK